MRLPYDSPAMDWSDVIIFLVGIILLSLLVYAFKGYYDQKNQEKLTDTERNKRMMDSITDHCNEYR